MTETIKITAENIYQLDLTPVDKAIEKLLNNTDLATRSDDLGFEIDFPREETDPRELSEIPEIRLWYLRLDARYPWLPYLLDWRKEFSRYAAMLVPHQFNRVEGIQYNPEALEIFVMGKIFVISDWLQEKGIFAPSKLKGMAKMLGYELDDSFFEVLQ
ncbi:CRR6 family NdhI maturation factor [Spirulina sp. CS-785/01]|uniref:CRR6 family NdhI maturation factor n=1 Tax=Spirulina sp. CS-785/01 TaxID=3021716 RepID=UPI00232F719D|nr:CRR6 family NdhI maturation factor [Spirulina sp. CS-785/01]MDB9314300.1 CRR6 family NdhI maturation factor [Spirulina sp. CS-785/01]